MRMAGQGAVCEARGTIYVSFFGIDAALRVARSVVTKTLPIIRNALAMFHI